MSAAFKARVVGSVVILVMLWPIAHYQLVTRLDVDPWRFYGFAMYCTRHAVDVKLRDLTDGESRKITAEDLPASARRSLLSFRARRLTLGKLHSPEALARAVFEARPRIRKLEVSVLVFRIRPLGTRMQALGTLYRFDRESLLAD